MKKIAFIGLGHMGSPMVKNLLKNNVVVTVFDISINAINALVSDSAIAATSATDAVKDADVVITMLQTGEQVLQICTGNSGIFNALKKQTLFLDCSTIDSESSKKLHLAAIEKNIIMFDAPVSGGVIAAENATLTFMVGGEEKYFADAEMILKNLGKKIIYAGKATTGVAAKICNNMLLGISMIGVCESFLLAEKLGLDPKKLFEISNNASGQCWSLTHYCPWPNILPTVPSSHDYQPGFSAKMMLKDLQLSQAAATLSHTSTPLGKHALELYQRFVDRQSGDIDFSGIIQFLKTAH